MQLSEQYIKRFWSRVDIRGLNECWNWKAGKTGNGYGAFWDGKKLRPAHLVAWSIANGREPRKGFEIAHAPIICHNRPCCNPAHLSEKTRTENFADKELDGTSIRGDRNGSRIHPESRPRGEKHSRATLTQAKVDRIRILRKQGIIQRVVAEMVGATRSQVSQIDRGYTWKE